MSAWFYEPDVPSNFTAAGGVAGLGEIVDAAKKQLELVDSTNSEYQARYQAYDDRIAAIRRATGQSLDNPLKLAEQLDFEKSQLPKKPMYMQPLIADELKAGPAVPTNQQLEEQKFSLRLQQLQEQFPNQQAAIRAEVPVGDDARALAKSADEDLARLTASRPGIGKYVASFAGGFEGQFRDPLQVASMFVGAGPGVGRSVVARIANVALKEALINGAVTAAMQPTVQDWRAKAGLPHGLDQATANVLFAAAGGAIFGSGAEALGAAGRRVFKGEWLDRAGEHVAKNEPVRVDIKKALEGDADAALEAIKPIRDAVAPEARAAIDLHETMTAQRQALPEISSPAVHQRNMDAALDSVSDPVLKAFEPELDRQMIERIVRELVPEAPVKRKAEETSLQSFLVRAGGLQDQKGEISALGLQNAGERFKGRLVRDNGRTLDQARELAAEAGYFNHKYGTAEEAVARSTIADLLDELDTEGRRPTVAEADDNGRSYVEQRVTELMRQTGPEVDEKLIARAVQLAEAEKIDPLEAFDRVAFETGAPKEIAAELGPVPIADQRADPLITEGTITEPDLPAPEEMFTPADLEDLDPLMNIPFFDDGRAATGRDVVDRIDELDGLFQLTEACKA